VTDVPAGSPLDVPVLGEPTRPRTVVALPILFQENLLGVLELGMFRDTDAELLAFMDVLSDQMGVAVNNLMSYRRTQELAEELKGKGQELGRQNEELGRANAQIQQANQHKTVFL